MLRHLFPRLTAAPVHGAELFAAITDEARAPHWYVAGEVPDTLDGRFAMVATLAALVFVRIEQFGPAEDNLSVGLTERFVEVMESEHRELGLGDPKLGRTVRKLVGSLARRIELWRLAAAGSTQWADAARTSVYKEDAAPGAIAFTAERLRGFWSRLERSGTHELAQGRLE